MKTLASHSQRKCLLAEGHIVKEAQCPEAGAVASLMDVQGWVQCCLCSAERGNEQCSRARAPAAAGVKGLVRQSLHPQRDVLLCTSFVFICFGVDNTRVD